jgi:hypothetical protein
LIEIKKGIYEDKLVLTEEEDKIVNEWLHQKKYHGQIDKRGALEGHMKLVYDSVYYFLKIGYTIGKKTNGDFTLIKDKEKYTVECGMTNQSYDKLPLIHVGFSRNILIFTKDSKPLRNIDCHYDYLNKKKNRETIYITHGIGTSYEEYDGWSRSGYAVETSVLPYFFEI